MIGLQIIKTNVMSKKIIMVTRDETRENVQGILKTVKKYNREVIITKKYQLII